MSDQGADVFELYRYDPSAGAATVFAILFFVASSIHAYQLVRTRTWFFIPFVLGGFFECVGYVGRIESAKQTPNWTTGPYIQQTLLLLIAPTLLAASVYMELGRVIILTDGEAHSLIPRKWLTKVFLVGDIVSFFMQGAGGGIMAGGNLQSLHTGEKIIIGGLHLPWEKHMCALYCGSLLILIRSVFRLIEYAQGNAGYLVSHEAYMYIFDGCLMFLNMVVFMIVHPSEVNALLNPSAGGKAVKRVLSVYTLHQLIPS